MRLIAVLLMFLISAAVYAADLEPVGTAQAERAAAEKAAAEEAERAKAAAEKAAAEKAALAAAEKAAAEKAAKEAEAQKAAAAEAERAAKEAAEREAAEKAAREAKEAAEREATAKAEREAKEAVDREAAAKAAREAKEAADRQAAEKAKAEQEAKEAAERQAAEKAKAEREAKEAAEREAAKEAAAKAEREAKEAAEAVAAAKAEREAKEAAEREAAEKAKQEREANEAAEREAAAKLKAEHEAAEKTAAAKASAAGASINAASSVQAGIQCGVPVEIENADAAKAITDRAKADAEANAAAPAKLTLVAQDSVAALANSYKLDRSTVGRAYLVALCNQLAASGGSPLSLKPLLAMLADALGQNYAAFASTEASQGTPAGGGESGETHSASKAAPAPVASGKPQPPEGTSEPQAKMSEAEFAGPKSAEAAPPPAAEASPPPAAEQPSPAPQAAEKSAVPPAAKAPAPESKSAEAPQTKAAAPSPPEAAGASTPTPSAGEKMAAPPAASAEESQPAAGNPPGTLSDARCRALGVLGKCPDLKAVFDQLLQKPVEYNHPDKMLLGRKTEIALVIRTDWEGKDLPKEVSDELKGLPGAVKQGVSKITRIMSAELSGSDFEISPSGSQERTVVPPEPVSWNWQVMPTDTGKDKRLKLRLYAHLEGPGGAMPPVLVKTLDANIDVDVTTWDWMVNQARTLEPFYAVTAGLLGLLTAILTFLFARKRKTAPEAGLQFERLSPLDRWMSRRGPVIGDLDQSAGDSRPPSASPPAAPPSPPSTGPSGGPETGTPGSDGGSKPDKD